MPRRSAAVATPLRVRYPRPSVIEQLVRTALLVDDEQDIVSLLEICFEAAKHWRLETAGSMAAAMKRLSETKVDVVLLDWNLPDASGPSAIEQLRDTHPIILMTAASPHALASAWGQHAPHEWSERGVLGVVEKPFDPLTLIDRIEQILVPARHRSASS